MIFRIKTNLLAKEILSKCYFVLDKMYVVGHQSTSKKRLKLKENNSNKSIDFLQNKEISGGLIPVLSLLVLKETIVFLKMCPFSSI